MAALRSLLYLLSANLLTALMMIGAAPVALASRPAFARYARGWAWSLEALARVILGVRAVEEGKRPAGPVLIAAKHESAFETVALMARIDDPVIVLKREIADFPLFGRLTRRHGVIPVDREASASALRVMLRAADVAKGQQRPVLIFPEGTRVRHGETPSLEAGFAGLYARLGYAVVPVATDASLRWPRGLVKRPGVIRLRFGATIPAGLPRREIEARVHAAINALNV